MAKPRFQVGDVCVLVKCSCCSGVLDDRYVGQIVTVLTVDPGCRRGLVYKIDIRAPQDHYWVRECLLRRKKPPHDEMVRWKDCVWRPVSVKEK